MKIAIGGDHAGYEYKREIIEKLEAEGHEVTNFGTDGPDSVDYPDFAHPVAIAVENKEADLGIVLCGSGNGVAMAANKHQGIRCALCWTEEIAQLARTHNDANVLSLPVRFVSLHEAKLMVNRFISTPFEGGRHAKRVDKIACM